MSGIKRPVITRGGIENKSTHHKICTFFEENAANGTYKITRLLYMNTKGEPAGLTKAFVDYIYSPDGQKFTSASGYIPKGRD